MSSRAERVRALRRARPRSRLLRGSLLLLALATAAAWLSGEVQVDDLFSARRAANLRRFLTEEIVPFELRETGVGLRSLGAWVAAGWRDPGARATVHTAAIAVAAMFLASLFALVIAPMCAAAFASPMAYSAGDDGSRTGWTGWTGRALRAAARLGCVLLRALPEYVWAFLLTGLLPPSAWPAVLALAIHNGGILGRLYGDTLENLAPGPLRAWSGLGARRPQVYLGAALPLALPRLLLYWFYRLESCVREATVLGMLGVVSLGYYIAEERARHFYDRMLLLMAFGIVIVLAGDLASWLVRGWVRRAR